MLIFGGRWDAPVCDDAEEFPEVPTYAKCLWCRAQIEAGDQGVIIATAGKVEADFLVGVAGSMRGAPVVLTATHRECLLAETTGHLVGVCGCTRGDWPSRDASREVLRRVLATGSARS